MVVWGDGLPSFLTHIHTFKHYSHQHTHLNIIHTPTIITLVLSIYNGTEETRNFTCSFSVNTVNWYMLSGYSPHIHFVLQVSSNIFVRVAPLFEVTEAETKSPPCENLFAIWEYYRSACRGIAASTIPCWPKITLQSNIWLPIRRLRQHRIKWVFASKLTQHAKYLTVIHAHTNATHTNLFCSFQKSHHLLVHQIPGNTENLFYGLRSTWCRAQVQRSHVSSEALLFNGLAWMHMQC